MRPARRAGSTRVRWSARGRGLLQLQGPYVTAAAARTASEPDRWGWVSCTVPIEAEELGIRDLMRRGEDVQVLGPPALRARLRRTLGRMAAHHAGRG